ncbi:MAG: hypothetical protein C5B52_09880 [Bacteroidetes bacterium]|nr:MAG: hypothetical protein C5B52_09880 [Bacteroidota bacterium]
MKYLLVILGGILMFSGSSSLSAQTSQRTISGVVTSFGESIPLEGVSVLVKGTKNASGTQADGVYYISISPNDSVLVFSRPGYEIKEVKIGDSNQYDVALRIESHPTQILIETKSGNPKILEHPNEKHF